MRARYLLLSVLALAACRDSRSDVAARVEDQSLSADRLARLMVLAQPLPLTPQAATELAGHWVTLTAFARRMVDGDSLLDSAAIRDLMTQRIRQELIAEWRRRLLAPIPGTRAAQFDTAYARALLHDRGARLDPEATDRLRQVATNPWAVTDTSQELATFVGGALTSGQLRRYVQYLSPATRVQMRTALEDRITDFLWGLVLDELMLAQAESAGVRLSDAAHHAMAQEARDAVHALWDRTGLSPAALSSAGATSSDRAHAAARRVEDYLDAAAARRVPLEPVPPFLAVPLLREVEWEIATDKMNHVVDRARRLLSAAGSPRSP